MIEGSYHGFGERTIVEAQLGRKISFAFIVAAICEFGWPACIRNSTFSESGEFNPNLYYLTCPYLSKRIATLEDNGLISELQGSLASDDSLGDAVSQAQHAHAKEWLSDAAAISGSTPEALLNQLARGAPRIADSSGDHLLKCLHAHYAFYLVHPDYILGRLLAARIERRWCPDEYCSGLMAKAGH